MCVCVFVGVCMMRRILYKCAFVCLSVCMYAIRILYKCAFVCLLVCMYAIRILYKCACVFLGVCA